ncbi:type I fatty acid synthase, putative, partial [Eimeria maxima]
ASANGYVRSEGCGALLLKALPRQSTDPSTVYAWIRGAANNHVGRSASLTAPNGPAQQAVIRSALRDGRVQSPADVAVLEAHGTGTALGDPIEVGAIRAVYCKGFVDSPPLIVGALKSLMGHAEGAAGIAGLIKLILVLQHRLATPNLHLTVLNPHIDVSGSDKYRGLMFPSKCIPLDALFGIRDSEPLLGAVSSFGFGGSNAHAIVEVNPTFKSTWTDTWEQTTDNQEKGRAKIIWLFTGQGSQYLDMACAYFHHSAIFRGMLAECTACLKEMHWFPDNGPQSIEDMIYGAGAHPDRKAMEELLSQTRYSQVAIVAIELGLSKVLVERGLMPDIVIGHSLGEYAAATVAGVMGWRDALRLVAKRASLLAAQPNQNGVMVACRVSAAAVQSALSTDMRHLNAVALAGDNAPQSVTISGTKEDVDTLLRHLGVSEASRRLHVSHAFHSPLMAGAVPEMEAIISTVNLQPASITIASTVRGRVLEPSETQDPHYWGEQLTLPVRFREAVEAAVKAADSDHIVFLEVGPQRTLVNLTGQITTAYEGLSAEFLNMVERGEAADEETLMERLHHFERMCSFPDTQRGKHTWNHQAFEWRKVSHPLIDSDAAASSIGSDNEAAQCDAIIRSGVLEVLKDHIVWGTPILPGVAFIDAMLGAVLAQSGARLSEDGIELHDVAIMQPMILTEGPEKWGTSVSSCPTSYSEVRLTMRLENRGERAYVGLSSNHTGGVSPDTNLSSAVVHAEGWVAVMDDAVSQKPPTMDIGENAKTMSEKMSKNYSAAEAYQELRRHGLEYGPRFQTIHELTIAGTSALVELRFMHEVADFESSFILHPSILDGCVQAAVLLVLHLLPTSAALVPVAASEIRVWGSTTPPRSSYWANMDIVGGSSSQISEYEKAVVSITLVDDSGNVVAQVGKMRLQPVVEDQIIPKERDLSRGLLWGMKWVETKPVQMPQKPAKQRRALQWLAYGLETETECSMFQRFDLSENNSVELHCCSKVLNNEAGGVKLEEWDAVLHYGGVCQCWDGAVDYTADVLALLQGITKHLGADGTEPIPPIVIVVAGAFAVRPGEQAVHPLLAGVRGLCRTARLELEAAANRPVPLLLIDLEPTGQKTAHFTTDMIQQVASILRSYHTTPSRQGFAAGGRQYIMTEIAVRGGRTFTPQLRFSDIRLLQTVRAGSSIGQGETCIITGGLGGLGLVVAIWLARKGAKTIILLSRTGMPPREGTLAQLWQQLTEQCRCTQVIVQQCDVARVSEVDKLFACMQQGYLVCNVTGLLHFVEPLTGIFHSAGVLMDKPLPQQDRCSVEVVFKPKVQGAWNLHNCLAARGMEKDLKYFVLFSSSVGLLGNAGQANYAAANCCIDELALYRRSHGLAAHSIQWGPWVEQGMAAQLQGRFAKTGFGGISNALGLLALDAVLQQNTESVVGCQPLYWNRFLPRYRFVTPRFLEEMGTLETNASKTLVTTSAVPSGPRLEVAQQANKGKQKDKRKHIQQVVMQAAKSVLNDAAGVTVDAPLQELGIDSLGAIEFRDAIQSALHVRLSATVLFDHPTVDALTKFLLQDHGEEEAAETSYRTGIEQVTTFESSPGVEAAVVGMACRFPASEDNPLGFWQTVSAGVDCVCDVPLSRFDIDAYNRGMAGDAGIYTRAGGSIRNFDLFDCQFFSISTLEAAQMDPRQRVSMEVSYDAMFDAGVERGGADAEATGVFVGSMNHETALDGGVSATAYTVTAAHISILSNRISYVNGFSGPSVTLDTACSSSLVALDFAISYMATQA